MTPERRTYAREYARRRREAKLDAARQTARTCPKRFGRSTCGAVLERRTTGDGNVVTICPQCERQRAGICRDCPRPVEGGRKALRCRAHKITAAQEAAQLFKIRNADLCRVRARDAMRALDDEKRARKNAYRKAWRLANPERVKAYKRTEALQQSASRLAYHAARRERERTELAARERRRYHGITTLRTCLTPGCEIVVTHRKKKCTRCRERARLDAMAQLVAYRAAS